MSTATPARLNPFVRSAPRKNMSITQTYFLAHKARAKLSHEAAQPDHDLRLLVGHANLLDSLMLELADAEREQERWFNQSVRGAAKTPARHVQWADRIEEQAVDDDSSDSGSDQDDDDFELPAAAPLSSSALLQHDDDLEEDYSQLTLVRTPSRSSSPPELVDSDSETSDDDSMPPSPADAALPYREDKSDAETEDTLGDQEYYIPRRSSTGLVSAISVY